MLSASVTCGRTMQANLMPADVEVLQRALLERRTQLRRSTAAAPGADANRARLERDLHELGEIDAALARIDAGTYGLCSRCGKPMDRARLQLFPAARFDMCCMENEEAEHEEQRTVPGRPPGTRHGLPR
jgi:hypothetical protein